MGGISEHIDRIQAIFTNVPEGIKDYQDLDALFQKLQHEPEIFRSIAYESASFEIGYRDLITGSSLVNWERFAGLFAKQHPVHIYIGLGWAFAKAEISPEIFQDEMTTLMKWMVYDGVGYYDALFRGRKTLKSTCVPNAIPQAFQFAYDEGIGRRLWYHFRGDVDAMSVMLDTFDSHRHSDLWRGIGIACGYVGGATRTDLELLILKSNINQGNLSAGIALAAASLSINNLQTESIKNACSYICRMSFEEVVYIALEFLKTQDTSVRPSRQDSLNNFIRKFDSNTLN